MPGRKAAEGEVCAEAMPVYGVRIYHVYRTSERKLHNLDGTECQCFPEMMDCENGAGLIVIHRRMMQ